MSRHRVLACLIVLMAGAVTAPELGAQSKPLRLPDIHGDKVAFSFVGDLWVASSSGGLARRLTAHPGVEYFAKFSPDGKWIAFTGQYDGDEQVYVIPSEGGEPRQLTFYPARGPLIDGGTIYVPEGGSADEKGNWVIEGHGMDPDIVVENDPKSVLAGHDPQLERGVQEVLQRMAANPKKLPARPADPVKIK